MNKYIDYILNQLLGYDSDGTEGSFDNDQLDDIKIDDDQVENQDENYQDHELKDKQDDEQHFYELLMVFLKTHTRLFEVIDDLSIFSNNLDTVYTLIKGAVQSGKSEIIHALVLYLTIRYKQNFTIILRNFMDDYDQMDRGLIRFIGLFQNFLIQHNIDDTDTFLPTVYYTGDIIRSKINTKMCRHESLCQNLAIGGAIVVSLANVDQIIKLNECMDIVQQENTDLIIMNVIIDEADQLMHSEGEKFSPQLDQFLLTAKNVIGISATHYECLHDQKNRFSTDNIYILTPPPNYKGISNIQYQLIDPIDNKVKSSKPNEFLEWDKEFENFLNKNSEHEPFSIHTNEKHPMITLIKNERTTTNQHKMLEAISKHPVFGKEYTCIVYNGTEVVLYSHRLIHEKIVLPICRKREIINKSVDGKHVFNRTSIGYVLQYLKNNGGSEKFPRILIIAHGLVGRGINIASNDFKWHLTHMFYRPSSASNASTLIQDMRLCGIYNDSIPLICVLEKKVYDDLHKAYMLQEDMFSKLSKTEEQESLSDWLKRQKVYMDKVPRRNTTRNHKFGGIITDEPSLDNGMSMDEFNKHYCITKIPAHRPKDVDEFEFERLTNDRNGLFKKWANTTNTSTIARFMKQGLDPVRKYTKKEITDLCKEYGIILKYLTISYASKKSKGGIYGQILCYNNNLYYLFPCLVNTFEKYF